MGQLSDYSTAGIAVNSGSAKQQLRFDQFSERLEKNCGDLQDLTRRVTVVADRILGAVPEAVDKGAGAPEPNSVAAKLDYMLEFMAAHLRRLRQATERLEVL